MWYVMISYIVIVGCVALHMLYSEYDTFSLPCIVRLCLLSYVFVQQNTVFPRIEAPGLY